MIHLEWIASDRLAKFRTQLDAVKSAEFLSAGSTRALENIEEEIKELERKLIEATTLDNRKFLVNCVITINQKIFSLTNYLGILLRSTNLRNCFEAYYAFEGITRNLFGQINQLIVSSEWDSIPFYIPATPKALIDYVIIGIPAFASRNALMLPLDAHELGHAVWRLKGLDPALIDDAALKLNTIVGDNLEKFKNDFKIEDDLFVSNKIEEAKGKCLKTIMAQCQEMFCDLFGASLFKESYVYAYDAFIAPGFGVREPSYPSFVYRAKYIVKAALEGGHEIPDGVLNNGDLLLAEPRRASASSVMRYADIVATEMEEMIHLKAKEYVGFINKGQGDNIQSIMTNLRNKIPPNNPANAIDILNAVWRVYLEKRDTVSKPGDGVKLLDLMNNLCIKSLVILEYRNRQGI